MAALTLAFTLLARDDASKTFDKVGDAVENVGKKSGGISGIFSKLGPVVAAAGAAGGIAAPRSDWGRSAARARMHSWRRFRAPDR